MKHEPGYPCPSISELLISLKPFVVCPFRQQHYYLFYTMSHSTSVWKHCRKFSSMRRMLKKYNLSGVLQIMRCPLWSDVGWTKMFTCILKPKQCLIRAETWLSSVVSSHWVKENTWPPKESFKCYFSFGPRSSLTQHWSILEYRLLRENAILGNNTCEENRKY